MLSDADLIAIMRSYLDFISTDKESQKYFETVNKRYSLINNKFLNSEVLDTLPDEELYKYIKQYTNTLDGPKIAYGETRLTRFIPHFKETIHYLLNSTDPIDKQVSEVISDEGKYAFQNIKKQFWTPIFAAINLDKYPNWNKKTIDALKSLGYEIISKQEGEKYKEVIQAFEKLHSLLPEMDFQKIDHLWHYIVAIPEGIEFVKNIKDEEETISLPRSPKIEQNILLILKKKQIILYGPPGTGKTYKTKTIAVSMIDNSMKYIEDDLPDIPGQVIEAPQDNDLYNKIVSFVTKLPSIIIKKKSSMAGYYSISNKRKRNIGLVWIGYPKPPATYFQIHLRKESEGHYPTELINKISNYKHNGWGGYPEFTVRNEDDVNTTIDLIKYAFTNF